MPQLRSDYMSRSVSLVPATPSTSTVDRQEGCRYCGGNESKTPPAELVLLDKFGGIVKTSDSEEERSSDWVARVFRSPRPLVFDDPMAGYSDEPLLGEPAQGSHYVVVTAPSHEDAFHSVSVGQLANGLIAMQEQVKTLYQAKGVSYVAAYADCIGGSGTRSHPHINMVSLGRIPPVIDAELRATDSVFDELGICPVCRIVAVETGGPRQILSTDDYVAFVPWAPKHDAEFRIVPKKHQRSFLKLTQNQVKDLAMILRCSLGGFAKDTGSEYTIAFHMAPERKQQSQYHWHVEVAQSRGGTSGLATGFGVHLLSKMPEEHAEKLGKAARREMAEILGIK
ncbi:MAG: galactose-1-phosphate uridylyltransferase [Nitrososphaerota archaeon]|nr:galactose-1-phosphate uridylyltransferase [Nitrososphaerota archaeon]